MLNKLTPLAAGAALSLFQPALAASDLQLHGSLAQGFSLSSDNNVNGQSADGGSLEYREAVVNLSWRPRPQGLISAQLASVEQGDVAEEALLLDYLLADWILQQHSDRRFGARAGKLKLPFGLFNDARDSVFSRPGILLPQSVYLDTDGARSFGYFSAWGAALYADAYFGRHELSLELQGLAPAPLQDTAAISILRRPSQGRFQIDHGVVLRTIDDLDAGRWRVSLTASTARLSYKPRTDPLFDQRGKFRLSQFFLSLQHNREQLSLTAELVRRRIRLEDLVSNPGLDASLDQDSLGYYLQAAWRFNPQWSVMLRYDERVRELQDRRGTRQARRSQAGPGPSLPRHYFFARDFTLGSRYDLNEHLSLFAELHQIDGVLWVNPLDNPAIAGGQAERRWTLFNLMLAYRF